MTDTEADADALLGNRRRNMDIEAGRAAQDDGTSVIPLPTRVKVGYSFNIEIFRLVGLTSCVLLLLIGRLVTSYWVVFPAKGEPGYNGEFNAELTYIFELFHFNHTCTVLDFNPSKTVSALVVVLFIVPMCLFSVLSWMRIREDYYQGRVNRALYVFSTITTPFNFLAFLFFYMVFVNSPSDWDSFVAHYLPFMFYQIALMLVAFEQCFYVIQRNEIPVGAHPIIVYGYLFVLLAVCTFYTIFVWSFLAGMPVIDTTQDLGRSFALFIMYLFLLVSVVFPAINAGYRCYWTDHFKQRSYLAFYNEYELAPIK